MRFFLKWELHHYVSAAGTIAIIAILLALAGFWTPESSIYWRRPAQTAMFFAARHTPHSSMAAMTQRAILVHTDGLSYEEKKEAALLFDQAGEKQKSSQLSMMVANYDFKRGEFDLAKTHANSAYQAAPSPDSLIALIISTKASPEERNKWIDEMQAKYPQHEFSKVCDCFRKLDSFGKSLPPSCSEVGWLSQITHDKVPKYEELSKKIKELPQKTKQILNQYQGQSRGLVNKETMYALQLKNVNSKLAYLENEGMTDAIVQTILELLPLKRPGESIRRWVEREGLCLLPFLRGICRIIAIKPIITWALTKEHLEKTRDAITEQLHPIRERLNEIKWEINYWQSPQRMGELTSSRDSLISSFHREFEQNIFNQWMHAQSLNNVALEGIARQ